MSFLGAVGLREGVKDKINPAKTDRFSLGKYIKVVITILKVLFTYKFISEPLRNIFFPPVIVSKGKGFAARSKKAEQYGVAAVRPQEAVESLMKQTRRTNLMLTPGPPTDYTILLHDATKEIDVGSIPNLEPFSQITINYVGHNTNLPEQHDVGFLVDVFGANQVISVDFENYKRKSYDGKK